MKQLLKISGPRNNIMSKYESNYIDNIKQVLNFNGHPEDLI